MGAPDASWLLGWIAGTPTGRIEGLPWSSSSLNGGLRPLWSAGGTCGVACLSGTARCCPDNKADPLPFVCAPPDWASMTWALTISTANAPTTTEILVLCIRNYSFRQSNHSALAAALCPVSLLEDPFVNAPRISSSRDVNENSSTDVP